MRPENCSFCTQLVATQTLRIFRQASLVSDTSGPVHSILVPVWVSTCSDAFVEVFVLHASLTQPVLHLQYILQTHVRALLQLSQCHLHGSWALKMSTRKSRIHRLTSVSTNKKAFVWCHDRHSRTCQHGSTVGFSLVLFSVVRLAFTVL